MIRRFIAAAALAAATLAFPAPAQAVTTAQLVGHRCNTWADRSVTNENTADAMRVLATAEGLGSNDVWCESDLWKLKDGTDFVWHDPTWGGAADQASLSAVGLVHSDLVRNSTGPQATQVRTKGGAQAVTAVDLIKAAGTYGVSTVIFEAKNSVGNARAINDAAAAAGVTVWMYKTPTADCRVRIPGWTGPIGAKAVATSPCTPAQFAANGISFVTEVAARISENGCARTSAYVAAGIFVIGRQPNKTTYRTQVEPCGVRRILKDRAPEIAATW